MNQLQNFSQNQYNYIKRSTKAWFNVAEGSKRAGKNVLQTYIFAKTIETHPDKLHLIAGVSTATARLNILDCDGFGLLNYFEGRCHVGKWQNRDALIVDQTATGQKIILISGGGKAGSERLIKGNSYGTAYITEVNECHPDFIREVFDRTIASKDRRIFHDLNPKAPGDSYYTDILDFHQKQQEDNPDYGFNYGHFTIADNYSLSSDQIRRIAGTYDKGTVWYKRDILGQRIVAEGLLFRYFAEDPTPYLYQAERMPGLSSRAMFINMGIDFGGNKSMTTFYSTAILSDYSLLVLAEDYIDVTEEVDTEKIQSTFKRFYERCFRDFGNITNVLGDNASPTLLHSLSGTALKNRYSCSVKGCDKPPILDRVAFVDYMLRNGKLHISTACKRLIKALSELRWNPEKEDEVEDINLNNINDFWDSFCYSFTSEMYRIEKMWWR